MAWFTAANNEPAVRVVTSTDGGATFGEPVTVASGRIAGYASVFGVVDLQGDAVQRGAFQQSIDRYREKGIKAGVLSLNVLRPFPAELIRDALKNVKALS